MTEEYLINDDESSLLESDNQEIVDFNEDIVNDDPVKSDDLNGLVIYSRDWTIETIINQIESGNIDLDPSFQRRNVWNNNKRSKLIESLIVGYPVPEVVLAEVPGKKKQYVVIDGKQRLLAIHGFLKPEFDFWTGKAELKDLTIRTELDGMKFDSFDDDDKRLLNNADLRCTILSGYKTESVLYDVFYRLNTGSVPLSMQELRNSVNKGDFSKFITNKTSSLIPLHQIMSLSGPDKRFKDIEIIIKFLSINYSEKKYNGNLKDFLDKFTKYANSTWITNQGTFIETCELFDQACSILIDVFEFAKKVGRKWLPSKENWESRFNRSLFEVIVQYSYELLRNDQHQLLTNSDGKFKFLCAVKKAFENSTFSTSVSSTTKTIEQHKNRFSILFDLLNEQFNLTYEIPESIR